LAATVVTHGLQNCVLGDHPVLELTGPDFDDADVAKPVVRSTRYLLHGASSGSGTTCELHRVTEVTTATGTATTDVIVARLVSGASAAGTPSGSTPRTVTLTLTEASGFSYSLAGIRRPT
jgi:hypothetical protein